MQKEPKEKNQVWRKHYFEGKANPCPKKTFIQMDLKKVSPPQINNTQWLKTANWANKQKYAQSREFNLKQSCFGCPLMWFVKATANSFWRIKLQVGPQRTHIRYVFQKEINNFYAKITVHIGKWVTTNASR